MSSGSIKAVIARAVDFYGPGVIDKSAAGILVFANMVKGKRAQWFINPDVPRSYNYTPDAARALYLLSKDESALGEVWHLPSVQPALTVRQFIAIAARHMNASDKVTVLPKWLLKVKIQPTPYEQAIKETANWFKLNAGQAPDIN